MKFIAIFLLLMGLNLSGFSQDIPKIYIQPVKNSIRMGLLAGNVNLTLGVKNILAEALEDKEYSTVLTIEDSNHTLQAELIYFDIMKTSSNLSVFHKNEAETIIRIKGTLYKGDKKVKETIVEESSSEISSSTIAIDEGGGFNQQSARQAVKKACIKLVETLTKK